MLLHIVARGKIGRSPEAELVERYLKRIAWPMKLTELSERTALPAAPAGAVTVLLDEKGEALSSMELAKKLEQWRDRGIREARFVIGAADGHSLEERASADLLISFGPATWPHLLVRAMLAEQLFRATSILANHPYHREGCGMSRLGPLCMALSASLLVASSGPAQPAGEPLELSAKRALAEARAAEAQVAKLQKAADEARDEVERIRAQQAAAAEAIAAAEARISAADANVRVIAAQIAARRERLRRQQAPATALLGGLAVMAERPPLLVILDQGSTREFVRVRLLLDSTLPTIRARTASLRAELERGRQLQQGAEQARADLVRSRNALADRRRDFADLESKALKLAQERGGEALGAGDVALARGEEAALLTGEVQRSSTAREIAAELSRLPAPPARPGTAGSRPATLFAYVLPAPAPVTEGLGSVAPNGVRSRGLTLATARGARVIVPASGTIRFSGPFRSFDAVVIIDHGGGWMSLLLNVASPLKPGEKVEVGQPLGRALGRIGVELSRNGRHLSPALIAGSSQSLSKGRKEG